MIKVAPKIRFHHAHPKFNLRSRTQIRNFIARQLKAKGFLVISVDYIFCTDDYLLEINKRHLNHSTYTDIITFDNSGESKSIDSEIYISIDRVRENAEHYKTTFKNELLRVMFHGILHLMGYKDKTKADEAQMRKMEDLWLAKWGKEGK